MSAVLKSPDNPLVKVCIEAICHDCKHRHRIDVQADLFGRAAFDWEFKHRGHNIEFLSPHRLVPKGFDDRIFEKAGEAPWWLDYKHNANFKVAYVADAAFTITLASLATSSTFTTGREATSVTNSSNLYIDYDITGKITTGTTPTGNKEIRIYGVKPIDETTPTWPDVFDGADSAETVTNANILATLPLLWAVVVANTSDITYPITNAMTLAGAWGFVPKDFTIYVAHNTAVNLNSTGGNQNINYRGIYMTSA